MTAPLSLSAIREQLAGIEGAGVLTWDGPGQARRALYTQDGTPVLQCSVLMYPEPQWAAFIAAAPSTVARLLAVVERVEALADTFDGLGSHASYHGTEAEMETWLSAANHLRAAITGEGA